MRKYKTDTFDNIPINYIFKHICNIHIYIIIYYLVVKYIENFTRYLIYQSVV